MGGAMAQWEEPWPKWLKFSQMGQWPNWLDVQYATVCGTSLGGLGNSFAGRFFSRALIIIIIIIIITLNYLNCFTLFK